MTTPEPATLKVQCTYCTGWVTIALDDWREGVARHVAACPTYPTYSYEIGTMASTKPIRSVLSKNDMLEALGSSFRIPEPDPAETEET